MVDPRGRRKKADVPPKLLKNYIKQWREFRGFGAQGDLSEASGITRATISRLETGRLQYRQWHLEKLAEALHCDPAHLLSVNPYDNASIILIYSELSDAKKRAALRAVKQIANAG